MFMYMPRVVASRVVFAILHRYSGLMVGRGKMIKTSSGVGYTVLCMLMRLTALQFLAVLILMTISAFRYGLYDSTITVSYLQTSP